ncbi:hypothetical protein L7F22_050000 [Adiantum nelumboides]|nr:hypothetical protein [Adiantum nelumboides]
MYGKCGTVDDAQAAFSDASRPNAVSWTAMTSAFVDQGLGLEALLSYKQVLEEGLNANQAAFVIAIQACALILLGALKLEWHYMLMLASRA